MSERDPALALLELASISLGIVTGDAMVKSAPLAGIYAGTIHPGKYVVMVTGDTASVEVAIDAGRDVAGDGITDLVFLPDAHPSIGPAISGEDRATALGDEALGIVETSTVTAVVDASDAGAKASEVSIASIRLADGLGGKGYVLFSGPIAEVEAAVDAAVARAAEHGGLIRADIIARLHDEMAQNLVRDLRFLHRIPRPGRR